MTGEKLCRAHLYWPLGLGTVLSSAPLTHLSSSFSLVSLTLCKAGWWYSALEFSKLSAVELAIWLYGSGLNLALKHLPIFLIDQSL